MNYWVFKKNTYDLDKLSLESFKQLTGKKDKDYYELTGKEKPPKKSEPVTEPEPGKVIDEPIAVPEDEPVKTSKKK